MHAGKIRPCSGKPAPEIRYRTQNHNIASMETKNEPGDAEPLPNNDDITATIAM